MKYLRSTTFGCKEIGIKKWEFVAKSQFRSKQKLFKKLYAQKYKILLKWFHLYFPSISVFSLFNIVQFPNMACNGLDATFPVGKCALHSCNQKKLFCKIWNHLYVRGVFAKNERGYRLNAIKKRFWSLHFEHCEINFI